MNIKEQTRKEFRTKIYCLIIMTNGRFIHSSLLKSHINSQLTKFHSKIDDDIAIFAIVATLSVLLKKKIYKRKKMERNSL